MRVAGSSTLDAPRDQVFAAIVDPRVLLEVIPGCQEISQVAPDEYRARIALRLPAIVGTYETTVRMIQAEPPYFGELEGRLVGRAGTIAGRASFRLSTEGEQTLVEYLGTAIVSGPIARLDSRFMEGFARSIIGEGLDRLEERLQRVPLEAAP